MRPKCSAWHGRISAAFSIVARRRCTLRVSRDSGRRSNDGVRPPWWITTPCMPATDSSRLRPPHTRRAGSRDEGAARRREYRLNRWNAYGLRKGRGGSLARTSHANLQRRSCRHHDQSGSVVGSTGVRIRFPEQQFDHSWIVRTSSAVDPRFRVEVRGGRIQDVALAHTRRAPSRATPD